jgi:stage V sporulation protein AE
MIDIWEILKAFIIGGLICCAGQALLMYTRLTTARILVFFVVTGVILTAIGIYEPLIKFAGAGASVPLTGFGYSLAKGVRESVDELGVIGIFSGGIKNTACGITVAIFFSLIHALIFKPKSK